ncbi:nitroreductase family protein [Bacillus halotolerans]|uniref:nitroreductase family protein n=1 Tax=Bacillus TaxID=1386 RepID=UPI000D041603|nr:MULTISPECIES: nitroreductase family protein [Bacillus]MBV7320366.1 nitroreductase family protein [Halalkalibacterium halodurans]AZV48822.1 nitroreductase family protein [Bacillus halotolerans]MCV0026449.1 nitroreductase family protein [Bacillus sp. XT-2]PRS03212.1 nitroreductase family protein [Bacillus halotolerans]PRS19915.1 nitroreductase family protein [Bacillus halotolerans]
MAEFSQLVKERRSASNFLSDHPITKEELNEMFEWVALAPSAFNLQHTKYVTVLDPDVKEKLKQAANGQYKVFSSSAVLLVLGDKQAYQQAADIYEGLKVLGVLNKQEYDHMVQDTVSFYESKGEQFKRDEAIRNASLSAMMFMLSAKEKGWDTCPMIGFDAEAVKRILNIDDQFEVVMMITIGKEKIESRRPRGYRKPVNEFVEYI